MNRRPKWGGRRAAQLVAQTLATYGVVCHLCGRPGATTADHVIPRSRHGPDALDNLRPAHRLCNQRRGDMPLDEWFRRHPLPDTKTLAPSRDW
ncbi:HNH endonuclease [Gordonia phage Coeur]|uniref:HNH endonuclease n=1 Tax=Gordonia phage Coeur TaxID=2571246 RepID=A0A4Y6EFF6_9CAUD|nr:HNH endonuclease [Gordonia phage Coeur]QDF17443.1 HNH endonuclease [Gordonia phage Coeur]